MKAYKLILIFVCLLPVTLFAQKKASSAGYTTAIGIRGGGTSGVTIKHFNSGSTAIEGIIGVSGAWNQRLSLTGLFEKYTSPLMKKVFIYTTVVARMWQLTATDFTLMVFTASINTMRYTITNLS